MKDLRAWIVSLFIIVSMILTTMAVMASAEGRSRSSARAMALYSPELDTFLFTKNADERLPMASTTKIMTALVTLENTQLDQRITIPREAVGIEGSSLYLEEGDTLTVKDLLYSLMLRSANDAATALAIEVGGDIRGFSDMMNARAQELGLTDTSFSNPHGLDSEDHYTTAKELCLIAAEALKNETFREITSTYKYSFSLGDGTRTVVNHNKLLKSYEGAIGVKTGFTKKCGRCLVSAAERDGITLVAVTLDAPDDWKDHTDILDYGFDTLVSIPIENIANINFTIPTIGLTSETINATIGEEVRLIGYKTDKFKVVYDIKKYIVTDTEEGDTVGSVLIYKNGELYKTLRVVSLDSVKKSQKG